MAAAAILRPEREPDAREVGAYFFEAVDEVFLASEEWVFGREEFEATADIFDFVVVFVTARKVDG